MLVENKSPEFRPSRIVASLFGVLAGLGGITHAVGEFLQGNVAPAGLIFDSWTQGPIALHMGGEPALSLMPNLLVTGFLAFLASFAVLIWSAVFVQRRHGGRVLIALSVAMLLVGGGFGPPLIGILAGIAGTRINATTSGWLQHLPPSTRHILAKIWPWTFAVAGVSGFVLVIGSLILVYGFGLHDPDLFLNLFFLTALSLFLTVLITPLVEIQRSCQTRVA